MQAPEELLNESDLLKWTGFGRHGQLIAWLDRNGIPYLTGKDGRACTTKTAINLPLLRLKSGDVAANEVEFG